MLAGCPSAKPADKAAAQKQSLSWLVSASLAAKRDLSSLFCERWRMPLTKEQRAILAATDFQNANLQPAGLVQNLSDAGTPW